MRLLRRLPDAYDKDPTSTLGKIIRMITEQFDELLATYDKIEAWRAIDNAEGQTLDDIGRDMNQYRGTATDEIYRIMLKSKTARDLSTGDTNTIIEVLSMAIDADPSEIGISETWLDPDNLEPAGINLIEIPIRRLNEVGMSSQQFARFVAASVAAGVLVRSIDLQGTFEYGGDTLETDMEAGFSNVEMETGGYYGTLYEPEDDQDLPL